MRDPLHHEISRLADGIAALRIVHGLIRRRHRMTPAEITKLTEQASRAKALMVKSATSGEKAKAVFDSYEATLAKFDANVAQVKANDVALNSVLSSMGNAEVVLDAAFQDDKTTDSAPLTAAPSDVAPQPIPAPNGAWPGVHMRSAPPPPAAQVPFREPGAGDSAHGG
jgi:hypothetical protein